MTTTEREQLLDLWRRVPECKPHSLTVGAAGGQYVSLLTGRGPTDSLITDDHAAALSRDAIVEWLTTHLMPDGDGITMQLESGPDDSMTPLVCVPDQNWYSAPTRLLALIAAANAVAGEAQ